MDQSDDNNSDLIKTIEGVFQLKIETPDSIDQSPFAKLKTRICVKKERNNCD